MTRKMKEIKLFGGKRQRISQKLDLNKAQRNILRLRTKTLTFQDNNEMEQEKKNLKKTNFLYFLKLWIIIFLTIFAFYTNEYYETYITNLQFAFQNGEILIKYIFCY